MIVQTPLWTRSAVGAGIVLAALSAGMAPIRGAESEIEESAPTRTSLIQSEVAESLADYVLAVSEVAEPGESAAPANPRLGPDGTFATPHTLIETIALSRWALDRMAEGGLTPEKTALISQALTTAYERLEEIDRGVKSNSRWTWNLMRYLPMAADSGGAKGIYQLDPPLKNASAVAFQVRKKKAFIQEIKAIGAQGVMMRFPMNLEVAENPDGHETLHLHYPLSLSRVVVEYGSGDDASDRIAVWGGVTDLPEYAKEAVYWHRQALASLNAGQIDTAQDYLKQAIIRIWHYRYSRRLQ